jgi:hypothetical protein
MVTILFLFILLSFSVSKISDFNHTDLFSKKGGGGGAVSDLILNHTDLFSKKGGAQVRDLILIREITDEIIN